jgi:hypothetical protein
MDDAHRVPPLASGAFLDRLVAPECELYGMVCEGLVSRLMMESMLGGTAGQALWNDRSIFIEQMF